MQQLRSAYKVPRSNFVVKEGKMEKQRNPKIDPAIALDMWNAGQSLGTIVSHFPGTTRSAAYWAIDSAVKAGLGIARQGRTKKTEKAEPAPPLAEIWK